MKASWRPCTTSPGTIGRLRFGKALKLRHKKGGQLRADHEQRSVRPALVAERQNKGAEN
ncbi:hypothetical protein PSEUDO9AG_40085 [Pseudomonas sp. 9Ag]|nr:hypothetical protein PSEUDO9AG_40085 [Pseudomonas sp. 9Ag]